MLPARVVMSPQGNLVVSAREDVCVLEIGGNLRCLPVADWADVAAFEDEAWVLDSSGWMSRFGIDGQLLGELEVGACDRLLVGPEGEPCAGLMSAAPRTLVRDCGQLVSEVLQPAPQLVLPLGGRDWLLMLEGQLMVLRAGRLQRLSAAPTLGDVEVTWASTLAPGGVALVTRSAGRSVLLILDALTGEQRRRCDLGEVALVRVAGQRGHAYILRDDGVLSVLDLRFGKQLVALSGAEGVQDFAVDARGSRLAVMDGQGLGLTETRRLFERTRPAASLTALLGRTGAGRGADGSAPAARDSAVQPQAPDAPDAPDVAGVNGNHRAPEVVATMQEAPDRAPLDLADTAMLRALAPRLAGPQLARGAAALRHLERHLALVGAWAKRAVCEGWDTGRLAFASPGALPFEHELGAMVDGTRGRAAERLASAQLEVSALEQLHDDIMAGRPAPASDARSTDTAGDGDGLPPLAALARDLGLSRTATDILLIVAAPAIWGELARLYAIVANDRERPLCDEWLLTVLLGSRTGRREIAVELDADAALVRSGLITVGPGARPFSGLSVHPLAVQLLYGDGVEAAQADGWVSPRDPDRDLAALTLSADLAALLRGLTRPAPTSGPVRVVVRGAIGSGRTSLLAALAARAGRRLGRIDLGALALRAEPLADNLREALRRCALRGWLPCVSGADQLPGDDPALGDRVREVLRAHPGPVLLRCGRDSTPALDPGYLACELGALSETQRLQVWRDALVRRQLPDHCADSLAARFQVGPGVIERVVTAIEPADAGAGADLETELTDGLRQHRDRRMTRVAARVSRLASWSSLILAPDVIDSVREFIGRVRHRRTVYERWGFDHVMTSSRGLTALFQGGPGTGKTMVAGVIARELGCDLYRIDLASVMSKWVGETERNLGQLFDAAEDGQAILLFDEADSLFARRTEVKSSNDRFANLEVNYLLQRLDSFAGIAILTTNLGGSIDPAFKRRLSLRLTFPFPDEDMRAELWRVHLPRELPIQAPLDLGTLARKYQLSGGYIRNVTLRAAFLAAHEGQALGQDHLERAVGLEYREMGKLISSGTLE